MGRTVTRTVGEVSVALVAAFAYGIMLGMFLSDLSDTPDVPAGQPQPLPVDSPGPWPPADPLCVSFEWLDDRLVCVPREEAG